MPQNPHISDENAPPAAQVAGGIMYTATLAQAVIYTLVNQGIIAPKCIEDTLDQVLLQWEQIAADPAHELPDATANARARLEAFLRKFKGQYPNPATRF